MLSYVSNLRKVIFWLSSLLLITPIIVSESTAYPFIVGKSIWFRVLLSFLVLSWGYLCILDKSFYIKKNFPLLIFGLIILSQIISSIFGSSILLSFWGNWWRMSGIVQNIYLFIFSIILLASFKNLADWISLGNVIILGGFIVSFLGFMETFNFYLPNLLNLPFSVFTYNHDSIGITSTIGTTVFLSWYLGLIFLITLAFASKELKIENFNKDIFTNYKQLFYIFTLFFTGWCLFFNFSRGSLLALFLSSLFIILIYIFQYQSKKIKIILFTIFIFIILSFSLFIYLLELNINNSYKLEEKAVNNELLSIANVSDPELKENLILFVNRNKIRGFSTYDFGAPYPVDPSLYPDFKINLKDKELLPNLVDSDLQSKIINNKLNSDSFCTDSAIFQRWLMSYDQGWNHRCTYFGKLINIIPGNFINSLTEGLRTGSRSAALSSGFNSFIKNPILGIGPQNFDKAYYKYLDSDSMINSTEIMDDPHNSLIKILVENGLVGLLLSLILYLFSISIFLRNIKRDKKNQHFWLLLSSALIFYFISSLFTISMLTNKLILIFLLSLSFRSFMGFLPDINNNFNLTKNFNQVAIFLYSIIGISLLVFLNISHLNMYDSSKKINIDEGITIYEYRDNVNQFKPLSSNPRIEMLKKLNLYFETFMNDSPKELNKLEKLVDDEYKITSITNPNDYWFNYVVANFYWQASKYNPDLSEKMIVIVRRLELLGPNIHTTTEMQIKLAIILKDSKNYQEYNLKWKSQLRDHGSYWDKINIFDTYSETFNN